MQNSRQPTFQSWRVLAFTAAVLAGAPATGVCQSSLPFYTESLVNGFQDWSWGNHNLANASPVYSGTKSIQFSGSFWEGLSFYHADLNTTLYSSFNFWVNGGSGGQRIQIYAEAGGETQPGYPVPGRLPTNSWQLVSIPLSSLGIADTSNFNRISIQLRNDGTAAPYYVDDVYLAAKPAPATVMVNVDTTEVLNIASERHFGVNLAMWDQYFDPPYHTTTTALLQEMGCTVVRLPGGSLSDEYHWASNRTLNNAWEWVASFSDMVRVATNAGVQAFITVNYGTGTPEEAAGWVRHANVTNHLGYKYWEIGNECYGTWETDTNVNPHDAYTYATRAAVYMTQMRAADPTIKIGVVSAPGENSFVNGYTGYPVFNPRTGDTNYGWTPVMLTRLKNLGARPDFLVHHVYPEYTDPANPSASSDNDLTLLQSTGNWAVDAADLRQQISDYFGADGTNIELVVTENNSDAGAQGRQSTSLVNGLYYADSLNQVLRTEFQGFVWWDFRNGTDPNGFFDPAIYGWRTYGDLGMVNGPSTKHPTFYAAKLMRWFARPGDKILSATTGYNWLSTYAARRANGSLSVLVLNKSLVTNLNAQISLDGFMPAPQAAIRFYGIPQDEAARTNAPVAAQDIRESEFLAASPNFTYNFPPLSMTLFNFTPAAPKLTSLASTAPGEFAFQIEGQPDVPYVIQSSTNLINWTSIATNASASVTASVTNVASPNHAQKFWRAVWQP